MNEGIFPSRKTSTIEAMEEERRLAYVAITRAEKRCLLSYAKSRFRYAKVEYGMPSRFLKDIERGYIELPSPGGPSALFGADRSATPWGRSSSQSSMWGASDAPRFMSSRTQSAAPSPRERTRSEAPFTARPAAPSPWERGGVRPLIVRIRMRMGMCKHMPA